MAPAARSRALLDARAVEERDGWHGRQLRRQLAIIAETEELLRARREELEEQLRDVVTEAWARAQVDVDGGLRVGGETR